jgi:ABC-type dipeptide/oligopeptide/nickel transport system permease subunit
MEISALALAGAEAALEDLQTRWVGMVVALVVILITVVALALIKRQLDRELEVRRARDTSQS